MSVMIQSIAEFATSNVYVSQAFKRKPGQVFQRIKITVNAVRVQVGNIKQQRAPSTIDYFRDKRSFVDLCVWPVEQGGDVFQGERFTKLPPSEDNIFDHDIDHLPRSLDGQQVTCLVVE